MVDDPAPERPALVRGEMTFSEWVLSEWIGEGGPRLAALYHDGADTWIEIPHSTDPALIYKRFIDPQSDDDRTTLTSMVRNGWEITATSPEAFEILKAAGIPAVLAEKKPSRKRPQGPAAVGTYPELAVLGFAAADARTGTHWAEVPGGGALVHSRKKAGLQVRFAPSAGGDRWADPAPGVLSDDLFAALSANGGLDTVFLAQVGAAMAIEHEHDDVSLDDMGRLIGRDPRTTKEREAMRRDLWERLKFLDGFTVWGVRKGTYRDPSTRKEMRLESRDALFLIGGTMWPEQATLDGSDVPLLVRFAAGPLLAEFRGRPDVLTSYGEYRRIAAIPGAKPSGAWARSLGLALTQRWREQASYGGVQKFARRYLLTQFPPAPTVQEVLADTTHATRARGYFTQALALLKTAGVIAAYTEPDPATLPRYRWADAWLKQTVDVTPPIVVVEAGESIEATGKSVRETRLLPKKAKPRRK
jgi:hypothetical protein